MRKVTKYKVSGVLETKPTHLPEGLEVEEVEVTLPRETIDIVPIHGGSGIRVAEYDLENTFFTAPGVMIGSKGIYEGSEVRKLRDFLNRVLGEENANFTGRVLVDSVDDVWFEFEANKWTQGNDRCCTRPNPYQRAKERLTDPDALTNRTFEYILDAYGPVTFIENTWEE
jgi:hypothetical protein